MMMMNNGVVERHSGTRIYWRRDWKVGYGLSRDPREIPLIENSGGWAWVP